MSDAAAPARRIAARHAADASGRHRDVEITVSGERIAAITASASSGGGDLVLPALVNAHDHARPIRSSAFGAAFQPLETWLHRLAVLPAVDPYLAAAASLGRSALGGAAAVMVHYTRVNGPMPLPDEAADVARAARDIGIRIGFAVSMRDRNPLVYGDHGPALGTLPAGAAEAVAARLVRQPLPPSEQVALADAVAERISGPLVDAQYGPAGPQWCSDALLTAVAEASARTGRRVHMHLLETRYQREWADRTYPGEGGIVAHLDRLGLLSPRLTLAHCTHARPDELARIAASGATIAVNTSSNLGIRSGIAPVAEMLRAGCRVAMGIDGLAFDEDDDALRELRLLWSLHRGWGFDDVIDREGALALGMRNGRRSVTGSDDGGVIAAGAPADLLLLDWQALDEEALWPGLDPLDPVLARATSRHVKEMIVAGRTVVRDGALTGLDHGAAQRELLAQFRAGIRHDDAFAAALPAWSAAVGRHFSGCIGCC
jgi:cytosine/adenosine deaminase-related metal-dependent hydrolase